MSIPAHLMTRRRLTEHLRGLNDDAATRAADLLDDAAAELRDLRDADVFRYLPEETKDRIGAMVRRLA